MIADRTILALAAGLAVAGVVLFATPIRHVRTRSRAAPLGPPDRPGLSPEAATVQHGWLKRHRWLLCLLVGAGAAGLVDGVSAPIVAAGVSIGVWALITRVEPPGVRLEREAARRDLVPIIELMAAGLAAGAPPGTALDIACVSLPGAAADRLRIVRAQLALGADPEGSWSGAIADEILAPLARTMARAEQTGAPIAGAISRLGVDLAEQNRAGVEERARAVGVKAAVPLGVCLLPAFLLLGIVPVAAGLLVGIT